MAQVVSVLWIRWALEKITNNLVLRITLERRPNTRPGGEWLHAHLLAHHYDDDGPVVGSFTYNNLPGIGKIHELKVSEYENDWPTLVNDAASSWTSVWLEPQEVVCFLSTRDWNDGQTAVRIPVSHSLVLQHLARLEGFIDGAYHCRKTPAEGAVLHTMENRLNGIIVRANQERERLLDQLQ